MFRIAIKYFVLLTTFFSVSALYAQAELLWDALADVTFEHKTMDDTDTYWLVPTFGNVIKMYEDWDVVIEGYLVLNDLEENLSVLSSGGIEPSGSKVS